MLDHFDTYINSGNNFTTDELKQIRALAIIKKVRRKQFLLQEGEICRYKIFVAKGLLKTYRMKEDGTEYIMRFSPENTWTMDRESYHHQTPSKYNIEALEPTDVMLWTVDKLNELFAAIPMFRALSEQMMANSLDASQERIMKNISYTSEEKYQDFVTSFPEIFRRVPLHMVASYLGVSRETLSRIRHAQLKP
jgi:CRP-like cAMP-binding protein